MIRFLLTAVAIIVGLYVADTVQTTFEGIAAGLQNGMVAGAKR